MPIIQEKDEQPRSADPGMDTANKKRNAYNYQYRMKNQAKGYREEKENLNLRLPRVNDKSYL
jgi:hypothetical protein